MNIARIIATELAVDSQQVQAAVDLLDDGSTVPFIARYRKEATRGLDDTQLRHLETRLTYLRELEDRRRTVLDSIASQGKLDEPLKSRILETKTKTELEDLYLPFKPKRRTKAQIAREAGLEPLASALFENPELDPAGQAAAYVDADKGVPDSAAALTGARHILAERFAEHAGLVGELREALWDRGVLISRVISGKETKGAKFRDYFDYQEAVRKVPSHRALALLRGRNEGILDLDLDIDSAGENVPHPCQSRIAQHFSVRHQGRAGDPWLTETVGWAWRVKLHPRLKLDLITRLREAAEATAIEVFARNLRDLLLAAPAGAQATIGLDPGLRTGVKVAVVDATGKLLETGVIYPHVPRNEWDRAIQEVAALARRHDCRLIAIGNGTASRETDRLAADVIKRYPELDLQKVTVSESGASIYSASELASREMPQVDVSLRGAVSIGRRLQDPLAELVKIDPKSIGVGQYQHDVNQGRLGRTLSAVVEDCVNAVGVDVNMASAPLLSHVSGLSSTLAQNIVSFRDQNGAFPNRVRIKKVPRLGAKTFEQCAGFLRIRDGDNPLDASAVHPEAYPLVKRIAKQTGRSLSELVGDSELLGRLDPSDFTDERFGLPTVKDVLGELHKPGRDPRPVFKTAEFRTGVEKITDLEPGMRLEGVVSNVTHFGAFVDLGVHQDGLVHISELADRFVKDPHEVVSAGDVVQVRVKSVEVDRKRIALSMRSGEPAPAHTQAEPERPARPQNKDRGSAKTAQSAPSQNLGSLGEALRRARDKQR